MRFPNYFDDGYLQQGYVAAVPRLHGALRFTFRPTLVEERSHLVDAARQLQSAAYDRHAAQFTAAKLVSWDLRDSAGDEVPFSAEALLRLQPELFVKLHRTVAGWLPSDVDPAWDDETRLPALDAEAAAVLAGRPVGDWLQESREKN